MNKTVLYITDNQLDGRIDTLCKKNIIESIGDLPLISVSQKPIDFGENICVGGMGRSSLIINIQMKKGLEKVKTEFIAIAEHDCLYTPEHFLFTPLGNVFWYNENVWALQYTSIIKPQFDGMFSFFKGRKANSQLICRTDIMIKATQDRIDMMSDPDWLKKYPLGRIGEAGAMKYEQVAKLATGESVQHIRKKLEEYVYKYEGKNWSTKNPNVDIRHNNNFTKNRRGIKRTYEIPYWKKMDDIF